MTGLNNYERIKKSAASLMERLTRKKIEIKKSAWRAGTFLFAALLVAAAGSLLWSYTASAEEEVEDTTYYCFQEAEFNYRVYLLENDLFGYRVLEPGRAYITNLTDYIDVDFEYHFVGESEAEIGGEYSITANLVAMTGQDEHLVWENKYELLPVQKIEAYGTDFSIKENIAIPLAEYLKFAEHVREETGYNPGDLSLIVSGNVLVEAETTEGILQEELSPTMIIPLKGNVFTVGGELLDVREGGITETMTVNAVAVGAVRAFSPLVFTASAIALLLFQTVIAPVKTIEKQRELSGIIKKHKDRIVVTTNGVSAVPRGAVTVCSFDELLKLADEMGRPILYPQPHVAEGSEHIFLIYTPEKVYAYGLGESSQVED